MLGGSSVGLAFTVTGAASTTLQGITLFILLFFLAAYVYGIVVGLMVIEEAERSLSLAFPFWAAQIPTVHSGWISYSLFTGAKIDVLLASDWDMQFAWSVGSRFSFFLLSASETVAVGVNVFALGVCYVIWKQQMRTF